MSTPTGLPAYTAENTERASCCLIPELASMDFLRYLLHKYYYKGVDCHF
jgi:hypothetical protein